MDPALSISTTSPVSHSPLYPSHVSVDGLAPVAFDSATEHSVIPLEHQSDVGGQFQPDDSGTEPSTSVTLQNIALTQENLLEEAQRHRGDLAVARAEVSAIFTQVDESSNQG